LNFLSHHCPPIPSNHTSSSLIHPGPPTGCVEDVSQLGGGGGWPCIYALQEMHYTPSSLLSPPPSSHPQSLLYSLSLHQLFYMHQLGPISPLLLRPVHSFRWRRGTFI
jgi:hypothetical protein